MPRNICLGLSSSEASLVCEMEMMKSVLTSRLVDAHWYTLLKGINSVALLCVLRLTCNAAAAVVDDNDGKFRPSRVHRFVECCMRKNTNPCVL